MKFGLMTFPTEYGMAPGALARAAEERGFESFWLPEHSHIPASRESPWPGGDELPQFYYDALDPFVGLAMAAEATDTILIGTGICLVVQRDPIQTAKAVATLDVLSGGRFQFGVGGGWNREEMANHGTDPTTRWKLLRERIEAMQAIWTQDVATYRGDLVGFDEIIANPKPTQKPHPPIHVGASHPGGIRRAIRYGDGWIPLAGRNDGLPDQIREFHKEAADAGRSDMEVSVFAVGPDPEEVKRLADAGVDRVVFALPPADEKATLDLTDLYRTIAEGANA